MTDLVVRSCQYYKTCVFDGSRFFTDDCKKRFKKAIKTFFKEILFVSDVRVLFLLQKVLLIGYLVIFLQYIVLSSLITIYVRLFWTSLRTVLEMTYDEFIIDLSAVFFDKSWDAETNRRILGFSKTLSSDELEMYLYLLQNFIKITWTQYESELMKALDVVPDGMLTNKDIYVAPMQVKNCSSASFVCRLFVTSPVLKRHVSLKGSRVFSCSEKANFPRKMNRMPKAIILLLDDYIGSGYTAFERISEIKREVNVTDGQIKLLSIAGAKSGIDFLSCFFDVICPLTQDKGISSIRNNLLKDKYSNCILSIASRYNLDRAFGYSCCEGAISLMNTPNNTFQMFYDAQRIKNPPFPRTSV